MKCTKPILFIIYICLLFSCSNEKRSGTVLAIPIYGQSLALGEESIRITNFDTFINKCKHRVLTENLDEDFGYFSDTHLKQRFKKLIGDKRRAFELSIYGMSELLCDYFDKKGVGDSLLICTFPGGQGATGINDLSKNSKAYTKFLEELKDAYETAKDQGLNFVVPAFCWMQGENDVVWGTSKNYKEDLKKFHSDFNKDVKAITKQKEDVVCICYQTNCITLSKKYTPEHFSDYNCDVTAVPQAQMELVRDDPFFIASGPVYPYSFVENERVHLDGLSQKKIGYLAGLSV
ncbi:MAG: sialate O-acetylesterase, partial [Niabella sp.]